MARSIDGFDRDLYQQRVRDREDLDAEHDVERALPATCGGCGARVFLSLWPQVFWMDGGGARHRCVWSEAGDARLRAASRERRRCDREARVRAKRAVV